MKPHKHAELIIAWADGAEIEYLNTIGNIWLTCVPTWKDDLQYRIKPEEKKPVVRWKWAYKDTDLWIETKYFYSDEEVKGYFVSKCIKLDYTRTEFEE